MYICEFNGVYMCFFVCVYVCVYVCVCMCFLLKLAIESLAEAEGSASAATSVDNDEKHAEHDTNSLQLPLAENLSSDQWLYLLRRVCSSLITLLSRIKVQSLFYILP